MQHVNAVALPRIMQCGGSIAMISNHRPETPRDDESNLARSTAMYRLGGGVIQPGIPFMGKIITEEMNWHVDQFVKALKPHGVSNITLDRLFATISTTFAGTPDYFAFDGDTLHVDKFVYGWRIVEPKNNWEMILWAILISLHYEAQFVGIRNIELTVHQVRAYHPNGNIRTWKIPAMALDSYYEQITARFMATGGLQTGPECGQCPASWGLTCPAFREAFYSSIEVLHEIEDDPSDPNAIAVQLKLAKRAETIIKQRRDALENAAFHSLKKGNVVPGFHLAPSQGNREWREWVTPSVYKNMTGLTLEEKLPTPAKAEQSGVAESIVTLLSHRPSKGMKLVEGDQTEKLK